MFDHDHHVPNLPPRPQFSWDWSRLLVRSADDRRAIYDERFIGRWDDLVASVGGLGIFDFTEYEAMQLLTMFATQWDRLPQQADDPDSRYQLVVFDVTATTDRVTVRFTAQAPRPDQIVVTHPKIVGRSSKDGSAGSNDGPVDMSL